MRRWHAASAAPRQAVFDLEPVVENGFDFSASRFLQTDAAFVIPWFERSLHSKN